MVHAVGNGVSPWNQEDNLPCDLESNCTENAVDKDVSRPNCESQQQTC